MRLQRIIKSKICLILTVLVSTSICDAEWPMPGHDPQRTSYAPEDTMGACNRPLWHRRIDAYIPSRSQIITMEGRNGSQDTVFVTAADGIHALDPATGALRWRYQMEMPPGDSPSVSNNVLFIPGTDKTIHAVNVLNGNVLWRTDEAGAPFYVNPLVVNGRVYAGSRDGYFYCFNADNGSLVWHFRVGEPIGFAAAYIQNTQYPSGALFFAANDCRAYALRADSGELIWRSEQLPADRFVGYWPVLTENRVLLASSTHYPVVPDYSHQRIQQEALYVDNAEVTANVNGNGQLNLSRMLDYLERYPTRRNIIILDSVTGREAEIAPFLWWGNNAGQRYPPAVGPGNIILAMTPWLQSWFGTGRYIGWTLGSTTGIPLPAPTRQLESSDEPEGYAIIGQYVYHNDGGDGQDKGGIFRLDDGSVAGSWRGFTTFREAFGDYWANWSDRKYGNSFRDGDFDGVTGTVGHQDPPVPLNGRVYFHRSNAVICMTP